MKLYITILITHVLTSANDYSNSKSLNTNYASLFSGEEIGQYFQYPDHALSHSISGTSVIEFNVTKNNNIDNINAELTLRAETSVAIDQEMSEKVLKIMDFMDDLDDVQEVHTNAEFPDNFELKE